MIMTMMIMVTMIMMSTDDEDDDSTDDAIVTTMIRLQLWMKFSRMWKLAWPHDELFFE